MSGRAAMCYDKPEDEQEPHSQDCCGEKASKGSKEGEMSPGQKDERAPKRRTGEDGPCARTPLCPAKSRGRPSASNGGEVMWMPRKELGSTLVCAEASERSYLSCERLQSIRSCSSGSPVLSQEELLLCRRVRRANKEGGRSRLICFLYKKEYGRQHIHMA